METITTRYAQAEAAASDAYDAVRDVHSLYADSSNTCTCSRPFRTTNGFGLHLGAIKRQADTAHASAYFAAVKADR